ncbi:MAG: hypothetical protein IPG06_04290 [Haliea sp.]|nr:hypothetical protein [Haliea sp.]
MTVILRFFDLFLPAGLRKDPTDLMRGYIIVGMILTNIMVGLTLLIILFKFLELEQNTAIGVGLNLLCLVAYVIALVLLRLSASFVLTANFLLTILTAVVAIGVQITGGYWDSPVLQLALQLPVTAFCCWAYGRVYFGYWSPWRSVWPSTSAHCWILVTCSCYKTRP